VKIKSDKPGEGRRTERARTDRRQALRQHLHVEHDPAHRSASGCIEASADLGSLWRSMTEADKKQVTGSEQNVLNGIAYDKASGVFYVTGKPLADDLRRKFVAAK
jgi:hypothetical protein